MTVDPDMGRYKCWSCGAAGDIFTWVMETQKVEFGEAIQMLAEQAGVTLSRQATGEKVDRKGYEALMKAAQEFFQGQLIKSEAAREYCASRGLDQGVINQFGLGYAPHSGDLLAATLAKGGYSMNQAKEVFLVDFDGSGGAFDKFRSRLMIPIQDERGRIIAYGGRIIGDGQPKYINSSDTPLFHKSSILYGLSLAKEAIASSGYAVLVEGYLDVIACHRAGVKQAVASLGTSLTEEQVKLMRRWGERVVVLYDRDEAGQKAAERATDMLLQGGVKVAIALPPSGDDPDSLLTREGPASVAGLIEWAVSPVRHRLARLGERRSPNDPGFWEEAAEALAYSSSRLELEEHLAPLAATYPNAPDKNAAMEALRKMAVAAKTKFRRRGEPQSGRREAREEPIEAPPRLKLAPHQAGTEGLILRALLDPALAAAAWRAVVEPGLMRPGAGALAADALREAFPDSPPVGPPGEWIHQISDERVKDLLMEASGAGKVRLTRSEDAVAVVRAEELQGAVARLRELRTARSFDPTELGQADDEALRLLSERLKKKKGGAP
jgi:DNA primase